MCDGFANFYRDVQETTLKPPLIVSLSLSEHLIWTLGSGGRWLHCEAKSGAKQGFISSFRNLLSAQPQPNHGVIADYEQGELEGGRNHFWH